MHNAADAVAAHSLILQRILSRLSIVAASDTGMTPSAWLNQFLDEVEGDLDGATEIAPERIEGARECVRVLVSGSQPRWQQKARQAEA